MNEARQSAMPEQDQDLEMEQEQEPHQAPWDDTGQVGLERELEDYWQDSELSLDDIGLTQESGRDLAEEYLDEIDEDDLKD